MKTILLEIEDKTYQTVLDFIKLLPENRCRIIEDDSLSEDDHQPIQAGQPQDTGNPVKSERILIVDDDPEIRTLLTRYLGGEGFAASAVENGVAMRGGVSKPCPQGFKVAIGD